MTLPHYMEKNRAYWERTSDDYQSRHGNQLDWRKRPGWGIWNVPESALQVLGTVAGLDVLEFGCGAAQWAIGLYRSGARVVGADFSEHQLRHARQLMREANVDFPLLHVNAEKVPSPDRAFDIVFCDHGAMTFADPSLTVPEAARLLRPGGLLAFNMGTPLLDLCWNADKEVTDVCLQRDYFGLRTIDDGDTISFQLPYGEWIRLFRRHGFVIEDLVEIQPSEEAQTSYERFVPKSWARRWPAENIWKVRRAAD